MADSGIEDLFVVNKQFLRNQLESGIERVDFVGEDIWDVVNSPDPDISTSFRAKEINWLIQNADNYGYEQIGNSWILTQP